MLLSCSKAQQHASADNMTHVVHVVDGALALHAEVQIMLNGW
jgi:hypothetical protein